MIGLDLYVWSLHVRRSTLPAFLGNKRPMTGTLYTAAVLPARMAIDRAGHLLDRAEEVGVVQAVLAARLAPDKMNAGAQIRTVTGFALRATFPLTGQGPPQARFADTPRGLRAGLAFARAGIDGLAPGDFDGAEDRIIRHVAGDATLDQSGSDYLHLFALPNLWFHLAMVYAIFRAQGLDIGKADFDGLHRYGRPA
jgi:hypothetical protein